MINRLSLFVPILGRVLVVKIFVIIGKQFFFVDKQYLILLGGE